MTVEWLAIFGAFGGIAGLYVLLWNHATQCKALQRELIVAVAELKGIIKRDER